MAVTDKLRNYVRAEQPQIEGNDRKFLRDELLKVQQSISLLNTTVTQINTSVSGLTPQAANTLLGNNTGSPATPTGLTPAQVKTLLAISAGDVSGLGYFAIGTDAANLTGTLNNARLSAVPNSALANSGITISGHLVSLGGSLALVAADVGLGNVTNDAQTKAAVVPNTAPSAGQLHVGNAGGTAFGVVSMSGDATLSSAGALTVTKLNGVSPGAFFSNTDAANLTGTLNNARLSGIPNTALANSAVTLGGKSVALGGSLVLNTTALSGTLAANVTGVTLNAWSKINLPAPTTDTYAAWDSTNKRYTPPAGLYVFLINVSMDAASGGYAGAAIYKNGAAIQKNLVVSGAAVPNEVQVVAFQDMSGTDYIEPYAFVTGAGATIYATTGIPTLKAIRLL